MQSSFFLFFLGCGCGIHVGTDLFDFVASLDFLSWNLSFLEHDKFDESNEVISAAEEHDRKGTEDRKKEEKIDRKEKCGIYFIVTERVQEIGFNTFARIVISQNTN